MTSLCLYKQMAFMPENTHFFPLSSEKMIQDFAVRQTKTDIISHRYSFCFNNTSSNNNIWLHRSQVNTKILHYVLL